MNDNNDDPDYVRPPDEVIKECLIEDNYDDFYNEEDNNIDEELKLALSISKKEYNEYIEEESIFTNIVNNSVYENLDIALEISKVEYEEYINYINNEKLNAIKENELMKNEELLIYKEKENRIKSLELFCKKIERLTFSEDDRKMRFIIKNLLNDWFNLKFDHIYLENNIYKKIYELIDNYYYIPLQKNYTKFPISKEEDTLLRTIFLTK